MGVENPKAGSDGRKESIVGFDNKSSRSYLHRISPVCNASKAAIAGAAAVFCIAGQGHPSMS